MMEYSPKNAKKVYDEAMREYEAYRSRDLRLDMSRGKPNSLQLDVSNGFFDVFFGRAVDVDDSVDDLFGDAQYTIGVQLATTGDLYTTWDIEDEGLGTIDRYNKYSDVIMALVNGKIDCVVMDNEPAKVYVSKNPGLKILETEYVVEDYAIALNKNNSGLYEAVNKALEELIADGTINTILAKYITAD